MQHGLIKPGGVDEYIANCPQEVQGKLREVRSAIRKVVPDAIETVSYFEMPGYSYQGYNYNGMFVWFSYKDGYIRLHLRPPVVEEHKTKLAGNPTTKSTVSFPADKKISDALVGELVEASLKVMKDKAK